MPRVAPDMPRQMLPPPTTTAISTPSSWRAYATSSAMRCTTAASMPYPVAVSANASPDSLSTTRRKRLWLRGSTCRNLLLAGLHAGEPRDGRTLAEPFEELADRHLRVLHGRLLEQHDLFVEAVEPAGDRTRDLVFGHVLVAALRLEHFALARDHVVGHLVAGEVRGRGKRDVQRDLVRDVACLLARRVDAAELDEHTDRAALVLHVLVRVDEAAFRCLEPHDLAEAHVLAQLGRGLRDRVADRGAVDGEAVDVDRKSTR